MAAGERPTDRCQVLRSTGRFWPATYIRCPLRGDCRCLDERTGLERIAKHGQTRRGAGFLAESGRRAALCTA